MRRRLRVEGVVQGVGFRPFVHRLATELSLAGRVGNDTAGVFIEVEGHPGVVAEFERRLVTEPPPLARIERVEAIAVAGLGERSFEIVASDPTAGGTTFVSPDIAVCMDCRRDMFDPANRRWRYPFTNCTNCGPRFTIIERLPYDRPNTTMARFTMCPTCRAEYDDPSDRRYHAQPIACRVCGPRVWFEDGMARSEGTDTAIAATQRALAAGAIVAVKGLGGYHLACDATSAAAVTLLRTRKHRPDKPLAVMVAGLAVAQRLATIGGEAAELLSSPQCPIVLLPARLDSPIAEGVAPGSPYVGVMLPYTPVHHLLFDEVPDAGAPVPTALVMTSGNVSDEPICFDDSDARDRLDAIADAWLLHDRPIHVPCDDSVVRVVDGRELPIRRARGYAPLPIRLPFAVAPILGVGGELKNAFCVASGHDAWMSQHIGDMGSVETLFAFERSVSQFGAMYGIAPDTLAADAHPGYQTRRWAEDRSPRVALVQHHHAHIAAVMAEHGVADGDEVIGFAFDGTGYGHDAAIWGGEVLTASYGAFERLAWLRYVPLPGGDAAIRKPRRAALAHLWAAGIDWSPDLTPVADTPADEQTVLRRQLERGFQCVPTSSMGRLFDAVSSLLGIRHVVSYEAQAAIELETIAEPVLESAPVYAFPSAQPDIDVGPVVRAMVDDVRRGVAVGAVAAGFHRAVAGLVGREAGAVRDRTGLNVVALSGGVFQNVLLVRLCREELDRRGFQVLLHRTVPPNDGGLALGQVVVASRTLAGIEDTRGD